MILGLSAAVAVKTKLSQRHRANANRLGEAGYGFRLGETEDDDRLGETEDDRAILNPFGAEGGGV